MARLQVNISDLAILLGAIHCVNKSKSLELHDAERTIEQLMRQLERKVMIDQELLESSLYAANILSEIGEFWHPRGLEFGEFAKQVIGPNREFDMKYNLILEKKNDNS